MATRSSIFDVLAYGPVFAASEELGWLITGNGAYLNLWVSAGEGVWTNAECRARHRDMYTTSAASLWDEAKAWLEELQAPEGAEE